MDKPHVHVASAIRGFYSWKDLFGKQFRRQTCCSRSEDWPQGTRALWSLATKEPRGGEGRRCVGRVHWLLPGFPGAGPLICHADLRIAAQTSSGLRLCASFFWGCPSKLNIEKKGAPCFFVEIAWSSVRDIFRCQAVTTVGEENSQAPERVPFHDYGHWAWLL